MTVPGGGAADPQQVPGTAGQQAQPAEESSAAPQERGRSATGTVPPGWGRYLVAPRPIGLLPGMVPPIDYPVLLTLLQEDSDVRVLDQIRPARTRGLGAIAEPPPVCPAVAVVAMPAERARALAANPQVVVEPDQALAFPSASPLAAPVAVADPALAVTLAEPVTLTVRVVDRDKAPIPDARVWAAGSGGTTYAVTDHQGVAHVRLGVDTPATSAVAG